MATRGAIRSDRVSEKYDEFNADSLKNTYLDLIGRSNLEGSCKCETPIQAGTSHTSVSTA
jgi:hypothetical protein